MPQLILDLTWNEHEALEALATREEIPVEELVRRAIDSYVAMAAAQDRDEDDNFVAATRNHLLNSGEPLDLEL